MDIKDIKKIIELMKQNDLSEFEMEEEGFRIAVKRRNGLEHQVVVTGPAAAPVMVSAPAAVSQVAVPALGSPPPAADADAGLVPINSPMVGTFYRASSPEADAFVNVGDEVDEDTVVCIIEAMKVMNEIKAERRGVIKKILAENATPVEYGKPLFLVEPL